MAFTFDGDNNKNWRSESLIIRSGAGAQDIAGKHLVMSTTGFTGGMLNTTTSAEDETGAIVIKVTAQNAVAAAGDIVVEGMMIELLN